MGLVDGLVPEVLANLEDSVQTSNYQLFQIKFWGYSHIKLHVQVIVVSHERPGSGTTRNHVHHWSFYFQEFEFVQVLSDKGNDF